VSPIRLFAVTTLDTHADAALPAGTLGVAVRDLAAVVQETPVVRSQLGTEDLAAHGAVVGAVFARRTVLPAPPGLVFPSREVLSRWLELHYGALSDAIAYLDGRAEARVHVERVRDAALDDAAPVLEVLAPDVSAGADEVFGALRKHAAASLVMRAPEDRPAGAVAAFLVERDRWVQFRAAVLEEEQRDHELRIRLTGPWPPYDFVRMQFGG